MLARVLPLCCVLVPDPAVLASTNLPPAVSSPVLWAAVGEANVSYDVDLGYSDPDEIGTITIDGVTGAATAAVNQTTHVIFLTPDNPNSATPAASPYEVDFTVCDVGLPTECSAATMTVFYNDPPVLKTNTNTLSPGKAFTLVYPNFFISTGILHGANTSDGDTNGTALTQVSASAAGPFLNTVSIPGSGGVCSVTGADISDVSFLAGNPPDDAVVICYIRVCEELPVATLGVCAITTLTVTIDVPSQLVLKHGFEDPE